MQAERKNSHHSKEDEGLTNPTIIWILIPGKRETTNAKLYVSLSLQQSEEREKKITAEAAFNGAVF